MSFVTLSQADVDRVGWRSTTVTSTDGSFEFAVVPRAGHLAVQAPSDDYVLREIGVGELAWGRPGGRRVYSNYVVACDPKLVGPALDFQIALRRGVTLNGRIIGPDNQPVKDTWIIGRAVIDPRLNWFLREWSGSYHQFAPMATSSCTASIPKAISRFTYSSLTGSSAQWPNLPARGHLVGQSPFGSSLAERLRPALLILKAGRSPDTARGCFG